MTSATDVVIFAIACMALNILVGQTGLVSFGHGAWFGLGAYAAALAQLHWFRGSMLWPTLFALSFLTLASAAIGFLVLRRRGVYFSLLTLALSALVYSVAFRWTAFTGGENGLGGVARANWVGADLENRWVYYALVASIGRGDGVRPVALPRIADRQRAECDSRERASRAVHRLSNRSLQAGRIHAVERADRLRRRAFRISSSLCVR